MGLPAISTTEIPAAANLIERIDALSEELTIAAEETRSSFLGQAVQDLLALHERAGEEAFLDACQLIAVRRHTQINLALASCVELEKVRSASGRRSGASSGQLGRRLRWDLDQ